MFLISSLYSLCARDGHLCSPSSIDSWHFKRPSPTSPNWLIKVRKSLTSKRRSTWIYDSWKWNGTNSGPCTKSYRCIIIYVSSQMLICANRSQQICSSHSLLQQHQLYDTQLWCLSSCSRLGKLWLPHQVSERLKLQFMLVWRTLGNSTKKLMIQTITSSHLVRIYNILCSTHDCM